MHPIDHQHHPPLRHERSSQFLFIAALHLAQRQEVAQQAPHVGLMDRHAPLGQLPAQFAQRAALTQVTFSDGHHDIKAKGHPRQRQAQVYQGTIQPAMTHAFFVRTTFISTDLMNDLIESEHEPVAMLADDQTPVAVGAHQFVGRLDEGMGSGEVDGSMHAPTMPASGVDFEFLSLGANPSQFLALPSNLSVYAWPRRQAFPRPQVVDGAVRPLDEIERDYILAVLARNGGNQTHTAAQLGIGAATLYRRLKSYGMSGSRPQAPAGGRSRARAP